MYWEPTGQLITQPPPSFFFFSLWLAGWLDNSTVSIKDILCLSPGEWGALVGEMVLI